ncbi:WD40-repeat-containing domain protein [Phycomyces nitens]|nr:WD40-repeat-containing domain protein [Phycomyces nitens]
MDNILPLCKAYPPAPNWYTTYAATTVEPHFYIYAARNSIVVLDMRTMQFRRTFLASLDKIQVVAAYEQFCFTGGLDPIIRAWNILDGNYITKYNTHNVAVTALICIRDGRVLISGTRKAKYFILLLITLYIKGDKSGLVAAQESFGSLVVKKQHVKAEVRALSHVNFHAEDYVAIGYSNGMIRIEKLDAQLKMTTVYEMPDQSDDINALAWQSLPSQATESNPQWPLLASSYRHQKHVDLWNIPTESHCSKIHGSLSNEKRARNQKEASWTNLSWSPIDKDLLYMTTQSGDIYCFDTKEPRKPVVVPKEHFGDKHTRIVFSMLWAYGGSHLITNSFDNQIIKWNSKTHESVNCIKGQNGYPFSISISPLTPYQAAIGLGDSNIKIWTFSGEGKSMKKRKKHDFYEARIIWKGLQGQIEHVLWHPTRPDILAYSTQYGRVGIYNTSTNKNTVFKPVHKQEYGPNISWGSLSGASGSENMLVSCGTEHVIAYDATNTEKQPIFLAPLLEDANTAWAQSINAKANSRRSCMAIDNTRNLIAFGYTDGVIDVYQLSTLKLIFVANCHRHRVLAISWQSPTKFASGCSQGMVAIHNIPSTESDDLPGKIFDSLKFTRVKRKKSQIQNHTLDIPLADPSSSFVLSGHKKNVTALAWSTHNDSPLLASVSVDMVACVWNEKLHKPIAWFREHRGRIFSVCWNILEPDEVFTCGDDRFTFKWRYTDFPFSPELEKERSHYDQEISKLKLVKRNKPQDLPENGPTKNNTFANSSVEADSVEGEPKPKKRKTKGSQLTCRPGEPEKTSHSILQRLCLTIASTIYGGDPAKAVIHVKTKLPVDLLSDHIESYTNWDSSDSDTRSSKILLLFGKKNDVRKLLEEEEEEEAVLFRGVKDKQVNRGEHESLFTNDRRLWLSTTLGYSDTFADNGTIFENNSIEDWIQLALSPMNGRDAWIALMEKKAKKLAETGHHLLAATCYTACSRIYEAIEVCRKGSKFREAIILAKIRLPQNEALLSNLFSEWGSALQKSDEEILAALCFLQSKRQGSIINAIQLLARRNTDRCLFWSACLSFLTKDSTMEDSIKKWISSVKEKDEQTKLAAKIKTENAGEDENIPTK